MVKNRKSPKDKKIKMRRVLFHGAVFVVWLRHANPDRMASTLSYFSHTHTSHTNRRRCLECTHGWQRKRIERLYSMWDSRLGVILRYGFDHRYYILLEFPERCNAQKVAAADHRPNGIQRRKRRKREKNSSVGPIKWPNWGLSIHFWFCVGQHRIGV